MKNISGKLNMCCCVFLTKYMLRVFLLTKADKYLIIFIIVVSLTSMLFVKSGLNNYNTKYISVKVDGSEYKKITFGQNMVGQQIPIKTEFGYNVIEVGEDKVRVIEADCPDKLDVKQGWISKPGEIIVCLPNRLTVEIIGDNSQNDVDYISH